MPQVTNGFHTKFSDLKSEVDRLMRRSPQLATICPDTLAQIREILDNMPRFMKVMKNSNVEKVANQFGVLNSLLAELKKGNNIPKKS